jgi:hypothetical protein
MPRVVPSRVVDFIDHIPPQAFAEFVRLKNIGSAALSAVLALTDEIPDELLTMDTQTYGTLIVAKEQIKDILATWTSNRNAGHTLLSFDFPHHLNPVAQIRDALAKCPDESPAPGTSELSFIPDADLRTNLRNDIGAINRALSNGEWKAATVLAGSTIEALLLWDLKNRHTTRVPAAVSALVANSTLRQRPPSDLEQWVLHQYIEVAANLGTIKPDTATAARLAKDFRNLIHPGRAQRLGQTCDRGTAQVCVGALDHVVTDLS